MAGFGVDLEDLEPNQKCDNFGHNFSASHHTSSGNSRERIQGHFDLVLNLSGPHGTPIQKRA